MATCASIAHALFAMSAIPIVFIGAFGRYFGSLRPQDGFPPPSRSGLVLNPERTMISGFSALGAAVRYVGFVVGLSEVVDPCRRLWMPGCFARACAMAVFMPQAHRDSADESGM